MAYGTKRYIEHYDKHGVFHRLEIQKRNYTGGSSRMHAVKDSGAFYFEHEDVADEQDFLKVYANPIQKGMLEIYPAIRNDTDFNLLKDIFQSDDEEYRLIWKKDGSEFWRGYVLVDLLDFKEAPYPYDATIVAKDFSNLKGKDYTDSNDQLIDVRQTWIQTIADLLGYLNLGLDIETVTSWTEENLDASITGNYDYLGHVYHETKALREFAKTGDEEDQPIKVWDALKRVLSDNCLILKQVNGKFKIDQLSEYADPTNVLVTTYDSTGTKSSQTTVDKTVTFNRDIMRIKSNGSRSKGFVSLNEARVKFDHRTQVQNLQFPSSVELTGGSKTFSQFFVSDGQQELKISGRIEATMSDGSNSTITTNIQLNPTGYYWDGDNWVSSTANVTVTLSLVGPDGNGNYVYSNENVVIRTNKIPSDADGSLDITLFSAGTATETASRTEYQIDLDIQNPVGDESTTSIDYKLTQTNGFSDDYEHAKTYYGDGPIGYAVSALRYGANDGDLTGDSWRRRGQTIAYRSYHENVLKEIMDLQRSWVRRIDASMWGEFDTEGILQYRSGNYFYVGGSFDGGEGDWNTRLMDIDIQTASDNFKKIRKFSGDESGTSSTTTSDGGGGDGGISEADADAKYFEEDKLLGEIASTDQNTALNNLGITATKAEVNVLDGAGVNTTELQQVANINSVTISNTQWNYVGSLDQPLSTTDTPEWAKLLVGASVFSGTEIARVNGEMLIDGDLNIGGTINYKNETNLQVEDKTITVNKNGDDTTSENAGLIIERGVSADESMLWDSTNGFNFSDGISANWINTGHGNNELYPMNQAVREGDDVIFNKVTLGSSTYKASLYQTYEDFAPVLNFYVSDGNNFGDYKFYTEHRGNAVERLALDYDGDNDKWVYSGAITLNGLLTAQAGATIEGGTFDWQFDTAHEILFSISNNQTAIIFDVNELENTSRFDIRNRSNATVSDRQLEMGYNADGVNALVFHKGGGVSTGGLLTVKDDIYPDKNYTSNIGSPTRKFLSAHIAELRAEIMTVEERRTTTGGRFNVGVATFLVSSISSSSDVIEVEHNNILVGDILHLEKVGQVEFIEHQGFSILSVDTTNDVFTINGDRRNQFGTGETFKIDSGNNSGTWTISSVSYDSTNNNTEITVSEDVTSTDTSGVISYVTSPDGYYHKVGRNKDGSGGNAWEAGDGIFNTQTIGNGFIDMYATTSMKTGTTTNGPTIAFMERTGSGYNQIEIRSAVGNLNDWYGYTSDIYGAAFGVETAENITMDPTNGVRIRDGSSVAAQLSGTLFKIGDSINYLQFDVSTSSLTGVMDDLDFDSTTYTLTSQNGMTIDSASGIDLSNGDYWHDDGLGYVGGGILTWDGGAGTVTLAGFTASNEEIYKGDTTNSASPANVHVGMRQADTFTTNTNIYKSSDYSPRGFHIQWHESGNAGIMAIGEVPTNADGSFNNSGADNNWYGVYAAGYNTDPYFQLSFDTTNSGSLRTNHQIAGWKFDTSTLTRKFGSGNKVAMGDTTGSGYWGFGVTKTGDFTSTDKFVRMYMTDTGPWGYQALDGNGVIFRIGEDSNGNPVNRIASAYFDTDHVWGGASSKSNAAWKLGGGRGLDLTPVSTSNSSNSVSWLATDGSGNESYIIGLETANPMLAFFTDYKFRYTNGSVITAELTQTLFDIRVDTSISGDLDVSGTFTAGTKNFKIQHPNPDYKYTHNLYHSVVESPTAGENIYRYNVEATEKDESIFIKLPDYFKYLNKDIDVHVSPENHYGRAYGEVNANDLKIKCETPGRYNVLVIGTRKDELAEESWQGAVRKAV